MHELELLHDRLATSTARVSKRASPAERPIPVLRRLDEEEATPNRVAGGEGVAALIDLRGINDGRRDRHDSGTETVSDSALDLQGDIWTPYYRLSELFPIDQHAEVSLKLRKILTVERVEARRDRIRRRTLGLVDPGPTSRPTASEILALSTWPASSHETRIGAGELGVDLAIALWRLRSWTGENWDVFEADKYGRRV